MAKARCPFCNTWTEDSLAELECGAFCDEKFLVCATCLEKINAGRRSRLCETCRKKIGKPKAGFSANKDSFESSPWGDNATRAREDGPS